MTNFDQQLNTWGQTQRVLPHNNPALKTSAINLLRVNDKLKSTFSFPWRTLLVSGFAVLAVLAILPQISSYNSAHKTFTSSLTQTSNTAGIAPLNKAPEPKTQGLKSDQFEIASDSGVAAQNSPRAKSIANEYVRPPQTTDPLIAQPSGNAPISDNREFLKTSYSSQIQSRNVEDFTTTAQTTVKGFGGRIDSFSASKDTAYISFSLPADKLDAFKLQIKGLAGSKFYKETLSAQNFLPQKQEIEAAANDNQKYLDDVESQKKQAAEVHSKIIANLNSQIKTVTLNIADVQKALQNNPMNLDLQNQLIALQKQQSSLNSKIANENSNYNYQIENFDSQIEYYNKQSENIKKQDSGLIDNVNSVEGTISISHINFLEYINTYLPLYWLLILFLIISGVYFAFKKRGVGNLA